MNRIQNPYGFIFDKMGAKTDEWVQIMGNEVNFNDRCIFTSESLYQRTSLEIQPNLQFLPLRKTYFPEQ